MAYGRKRGYENGIGHSNADPCNQLLVWLGEIASFSKFRNKLPAAATPCRTGAKNANGLTGWRENGSIRFILWFSADLLWLERMGSLSRGYVGIKDAIVSEE